MRTIRCQCGNVIILSDANRCPFCHMDLVCHTDAYVRKHINDCRERINPYVYSDRGPGRPSHKVKKEILEGRSFRKHCRNCGAPHCNGIDEGCCENWTSMLIDRCPFCGRVPIEVEKDGTHAIICDECSVKMVGGDRDELVARWNRR